MCGEKTWPANPNVAREGSPPRVRGKASQALGLQIPAGITPACAGKRNCAGQPRLGCRDHPRVCGEKIKAECHRYGLKGSPPRVRGKVGTATYGKVRWGITPACAGKRSTVRPAGSAAGDHPRVCGEKVVALDALGVVVGSPPRVRGKERATEEPERTARITPACAGKRPSNCCRSVP